MQTTRKRRRQTATQKKSTGTHATKISNELKHNRTFSKFMESRSQETRLKRKRVKRKLRSWTLGEGEKCCKVVSLSVCIPETAYISATLCKLEFQTSRRHDSHVVAYTQHGVCVDETDTLAACRPTGNKVANTRFNRTVGQETWRPRPRPRLPFPTCLRNKCTSIKETN